MRDAVETRSFLVVGSHNVPRCEIRIGGIQHHVACTGVVVPAAARRQVNRAQLPLPSRIINACLKPARLFLVTDLEPILDQLNSIRLDELFQHGAAFEKVAVLFLGTKSHDIFHSGTVIPTSIKDHDLTCRREVRQVALDVHLSFLAIGRSGKRHHTEYPRADPFRYSFDRSSLTGAVTPFEHDNDAQSLVLHPLLEYAELRLKPLQLFFVVLSLHLRLDLK